MNAGSLKTHNLVAGATDAGAIHHVSPRLHAENMYAVANLIIAGIEPHVFQLTFWPHSGDPQTEIVYPISFEHWQPAPDRDREAYIKAMRLPDWQIYRYPLAAIDMSSLKIMTLRDFADREVRCAYSRLRVEEGLQPPETDTLSQRELQFVALAFRFGETEMPSMSRGLLPDRFYKFGSRQQNLTRSAAFLLAEIERIKRGRFHHHGPKDIDKLLDTVRLEFDNTISELCNEIRDAIKYRSKQ